MFEKYGQETSKINKDILMMMAMSGGNMGEMNPMMLMALSGGKGLANMSSNAMTARFLPQEVHQGGMSFNGDIVLAGQAIKFDEEFNASITTTEGMQLDMPLLSMPAKVEDIKPGDIIEADTAYIAVKKVHEGKIIGLDVTTSNTVSHVITNSAFGMANIRKIFNPFGSNGQMDPMMMMMLMA